MTHRSPLVLALLVSLVSVSLISCGEPAVVDHRPNVVVIVIDTLRADRLPFYGHVVDTAPFLTSLAERGLIFDNAWSSSSWTAPATASIFTGRYPNQHGVRLGLRAGQHRAEEVEEYELNRIPDELMTIPVFMRSLGYTTFGVSANPNVDPRLGFERGFDHFAPFDRSRGKGAATVREALLRWRSEILASEPYFLYLHLADTHGPYHRHPEWTPPGEPPPDNLLDDTVAYDSEIRFADENLRMIFEELGLGEGTLVIMTSDHGQEFMDHGHRGHGWQLYSELTRVPLFVYYKDDDRVQGRRAENVTTLDIIATLADLLGVEPPSDLTGRSLIESSAADEGGKQAAFSMRMRHDDEATHELFSVVAGQYKLILHDPEGRIELYDLAADPGEKRNLAGTRKDLEVRLLATIEAQRKQARATSLRSSTRITLDADLIRALEELGYVEGGVNVGDAPPAGD